MNAPIATLTLTVLALAHLTGCDRRPPAPAPSPTPTPATTPAAEPATQAPTVQAPAPAIPPADTAPAPARPAFKPSVHGFAFVNSFRGSPLPPSLRPLERAFGSAIPDRFGLCGGMCAAAADYYLAEHTVPDVSAAPVEGDDLYAYLYQRQVDSMAGITIPLRVLQSMAALDTGAEGLHAMSARELPSIRKRLADGELVQLCIILVKAGRGAAPWDNHQVLAFADATTDERSPVLRIYDPNYPGDDAATLNLSPTDDGFACTRTAHRPSGGPPRVTTVRGLFATPYSKRNPTPPAAAPSPKN